MHFQLKVAAVEQNNVKGEKCFFPPPLDEISLDPKRRILTISFEFRPLTPQKKITYGQKNQQEEIIAKAAEEIPKLPDQPGKTDVSSAQTSHVGKEYVSSPEALAALNTFVKQRHAEIMGTRPSRSHQISPTLT